MIMKRATNQLRKAGIPFIVIKRDTWGYSMDDYSIRRQKVTVYKNVADCVAAALAGERPIDLDRESEKA